MVTDPIPSNEQERLNTLHSYFVLETTKETQFAPFISLATILCQCKTAFIVLVNNEDDFFMVKPEHEAEEIINISPLYHTFHLAEEVLEVEYPSQDPRFQEPVFVSGEKIGFFAAVPLKDPEGDTIAFLCTMDKTSKRLTDEQKNALKILGEQVKALIIEKKKKPLVAYLENAVNLSEELICIMGKDGYFRKINPAFSHVLGYEASFFLSQSIFELVPPDEATVLRKILKEVIEGKKSIKLTQRLRSKEGQYKHIAWEAICEPTTGDIFAIGRDITEESKKEYLLQKSERKFRTFFENSQGLMYTHDLKGNFLSANNYGAKLLGLSPAEMVGQNLFDLVPINYHPQVHDYLSRIKERGNAEGMLTTLHKNGVTKKVWLYNNSLERSSDGYDYVIGNSIDITERLKLERDIQDTKELLHQTNQMARIGGWKLNLLKNKITWTEVTRDIHEVDDAFEPTQESVASFFEEGEERNKIIKLFEEAIVNGKSWDEKLKIKTARGRIIWIRVIGKPVFEKGKCIMVQGSFQDIDNEFKKEEDIKRKKEMLVAISTATDELLSNRNFYEATYFSLILLTKSITADRVTFYKNSLDEEDGQHTNHMFEWNKKDDKAILKDPEQQKIPFKFLADYLSDLSKKNPIQIAYSEASEDSVVKKTMYEKGIRLILVVPIIYEFSFWGFISFENHKSENKWAETEISLLTTFSNSISNAINRNVLEKNLIQAKEQAELANKAKSDFLANMSHEIRTPLNGVVGFTNLVLKTELNKTQQQYLNIVHQSANSLLNIINDILDFSKIEAGKLKLDIEKCDIYDLVSQAADVVSFGGHTKGLEMLLNVSQNLPRYIYVDEVRIKQILINLLGNAIKFTYEGEIELKISALHYSLPDHCTYRFEVRDTGIGIAKDKQDKIFEAFSQADESTTKNYGGTGLGLTISNKLLAMMGSELQLTSEPRKGSTFYFDLTLKSEEGANINSLNKGLIRKALIVDDNDNNRSILQEMLCCKEIEVQEAKNGFEALQLIGKDQDYDLILMDYQMPFMDGIETIQKIKESFANMENKTSIILMHSASDHELILKASESLGTHHQLIKPIKLNEMFNTLALLGEKSSLPKKDRTQIDEETDHNAYKVLIAEDNPTNMFLTRLIIQRFAPNVIIHEANDGLKALEYCQKEVPSIVFMDIQMPLMNGYEAAKNILKLPHCIDVPIVALSAGNVLGEREKCLEAGMVDFIPKPVVEENVKMIFNKWVKQQAPAPSSSLPNLPILNSEETMPERLNVEKIKEFLGDDPLIIKEILHLTLEELWETSSRFEPFINQKDIKGLKAAGHKLKGSCMIAGLDKLLGISRSFESFESFEKDDIGQMMSSLLIENELAIQVIEEFLKKDAEI